MKWKLLIFVCLFLLIGCTDNTTEIIENVDDIPALEISKYNNYENVNVNASLLSLESADKQYNLMFSVKNMSDEDIFYGLRWYLEILKDGDWYRIDFLQNKNGSYAEVKDIAIVLEDNIQTKIEVPLYGYYQVPLEAGEYRLVQPINGKLLSLPFTIESSADK